MKKTLVCPFCRSLITLEGDEEVIKCPSCGRSLGVQQAERLASLLVVRNNNAADTALYVSGDYRKAKEAYENVLALEEDSPEAAKGLILATIFLSTLHESHLKEALKVLEERREIIAGGEGGATRAADLSKAVTKGTDKYLSALRGRTSENGVFVGEKERDFYLEALRDVIALREALIRDVLTSQALLELKKSREDLESEIADLRREAAKKYSVDESGKLRETLKEEGVPASEEIFPDRRKLYRKKNAAVAVLSVAGSVLGLGIVLILALWSRYIIGLSIAAVGAVFTLAAYIAYRSLKSKLA